MAPQKGDWIRFRRRGITRAGEIVGFEPDGAFRVEQSGATLTAVDPEDVEQPWEGQVGR